MPKSIRLFAFVMSVALVAAQAQSALDPEIKEAAEQALATLVKLGAEIREVAMEVSSDRTVIRSEAYAYHSENVAKHPELTMSTTASRCRSWPNC